MHGLAIFEGQLPDVTDKCTTAQNQQDPGSVPSDDKITVESVSRSCDDIKKGNLVRYQVADGSGTSWKERRQI